MGKIKLFGTKKEERGCVCGICARDNSIYYRKVDKQVLESRIEQIFLAGDYHIDIRPAEGRIKPQELMHALKCLYKIAGKKLFCSMHEQNGQVTLLANYEENIEPGELLMTILYQNSRCDVHISQATAKDVVEYATHMTKTGRRLLELNQEPGKEWNRI